ncbi:hypothetical protein J3R30DRAFT_3447495 [Lentinula aciculospora]|uniref:Rad26 atrip n=1 Tax=Lentinula aciculospora TaxID=153920 RepID=A0A9W9AI39_9AGAR|nr:hypothetical protein J3R30DRAFT_3447495 [Lentinula aciculospora]
MDEYDFDDDLDDQTLAALDEIEKSLLTKKHSSPAPNPPAKRQKTETGWRSATPTNNSFDLDELPEISLCQNTYTFQHTDGLKSPSLTPQAQLPREADLRVATRAPVASSSRNIPRKSIIESDRHYVPPSLPVIPTRTTASNRTSTHRNQPASRSSFTRSRNSARLLEHITNALANAPPEPLRSSTSRQPPLLATTHGSTPASQPTAVLPPSPPALKINDEIVAFQVQLEKMRLENDKIRVALKDAEEARIAKIGEVAVLRRGIQKTAEDHAAQISRLKTAQEEADGKQTSIQRDLKEEMERLKTQFIFKQHELESSSRRIPMSIHPRRNIREMPSSTRTPVRGIQAVGPSSAKFVPPHLTPVRAPLSIIHPLELKSPEKTRQSAMLPGFQNSFLESTPKRQFNKGKASIIPEIHRPLFDVPPTAVLADSFEMDIDGPPLSSPNLVPTDELTSSSTPQDDDDNKDGMSEDEDEDDTDDIHFNWKAELTRVVLIHTHPCRSRSTFQILTEQSTIVSAPEDFSSQISRILEVIASTPAENDYHRAISVVTQCLISMASALNHSNLIPPLMALLNLLSTLIYSLPSFNWTILHQSAENDDHNVLVLLCDIIKKKLAVAKHSDDTLPVANEAFTLAESLCWRTPEDSVEKLDMVVRKLDILTILLDHLQPCWFLIRATRLLALISTYPHLARSFLSLPIPESEKDDHSVIIPKIPQLDRLCSFLIDTTRPDEESAALKENIATLIIVLSQAHPDALAALTSSNAIIPSLVLYLTYLSSPIWEEDESLTSSPSSLSSTVRSLTQTIHLLHFLVFSVEPEIGLKSKLQHASARPFNGVTHMFIITFGRLSYAPIPDYIESDREDELSAIRGTLSSCIHHI